MYNQAQAAPGRIVVSGLTKQFGQIRAVDNLGFSVEPGSVTGFLGPNGAGKTTTLRMLLGLVRPTSGSATFDGVPYANLQNPLRTVGAVLEASSFHPARTARNHVRVYCAAAGLPANRADEVLDLVGLRDAARRKAKGFSLGMRQRLALATALLGDPRILIMDEPTNGLDPEGIRWLRGFLKYLADQGRTVLVSSHLLSEVEQTVDRVVILARGQCVKQGTLAELAAGEQSSIVVRSPQATQLAAALAAAQGQVTQIGPDELRVTGLETPAVSQCALSAGCEVHELRVERVDLEAIFFRLTSQPQQPAFPQPPAGNWPQQPPVQPPAGYQTGQQFYAPGPSAPTGWNAPPPQNPADQAPSQGDVR